jgi:hypothetical protein
MKRHVHRRSDGIVVICGRAWCARSLRSESVSYLVLLSAPLAGAGIMSALGSKGLQVMLALLAVVALVVGGWMLDARVESDARGAGRAPRASQVADRRRATADREGSRRERS